MSIVLPNPLPLTPYTWIHPTWNMVTLPCSSLSARDHSSVTFTASRPTHNFCRHCRIMCENVVLPQNLKVIAHKHKSPKLCKITFVGSISMTGRANHIDRTKTRLNAATKTSRD